MGQHNNHNKASNFNHEINKRCIFIQKPKLRCIEMHRNSQTGCDLIYWFPLLVESEKIGKTLNENSCHPFPPPI